jgi:hypothetical protein
MQLMLGDEQARELAEILEGVLGDLRMEVANTDSQPMREDLKRRERFLEEVIGRLRSVPPR